MFNVAWLNIIFRKGILSCRWLSLSLESIATNFISCQQEAVNQDILQIPNPGEIGCVIHVRADIYVWLSLTPREIYPCSARTLARAENDGFLFTGWLKRWVQLDPQPPTERFKHITVTQLMGRNLSA